MPANSLPDPSLMFLYLCMQNSDFTKIDFTAVGAATGLNVPAARMRYSRLKKAIESGIVDGKVNLKPAESIESDGISASPSPQKKKRVIKRKKDIVRDDKEDDVEDGDDHFDGA